MTTTKDMLSNGEFEQKSLEILQRIDAEFRRTAIDFRRGDVNLELWWCPGGNFDIKQLGQFAKPQRVGRAIRIVEMVYNDDELLGEEERVQTSDYGIEVDISEKQTLSTPIRRCCLIFQKPNQSHSERMLLSFGSCHRVVDLQVSLN